MRGRTVALVVRGPIERSTRATDASSSGAMKSLIHKVKIFRFARVDGARTITHGLVVRTATTIRETTQELEEFISLAHLPRLCLRERKR